MGMKIFLYLCNLFIPALMLFFGITFKKHPPGKVNMAYGYRTARSMKNQETWEFAHEYCGMIWKRAGGIMLVLTMAVSLTGFFTDADGFGMLSIVLNTLQIAALIGSIYPVEKALKENFNENGHRREEKL